jgi:hypothetical protein
MGGTVSRRSLLSGGTAALGTGLLNLDAASAAGQPLLGASPMPNVIHFSVPFGINGRMGGSRESETYLEQLIKAAVVPPLSDVVIYVHGWLTDTNSLMVIYDTLSLGFDAELRAARSLQARASAAAAASALVLPTSTLVITTHWPSRLNDLGGPIDIAEIAAFSKMEVRANLVGGLGMVRLIGLVSERLLADPDLAGTRLLLVGHSFGGRILAGALNALPGKASATYAAIQDRNPISLIMLQPAMPADVLESTTINSAHPFGELVRYKNLRILTTVSQWDIPLVKYYPAQEAQQPADTVYALVPSETRAAVPALGGVGPTDATWMAFNAELHRSTISVGPGFRYVDAVPHAGQRLAVADLTPLHATHHQEDLIRAADEVPPIGRPDRRSMGYSGYHTDIYNKEVYELVIGFAWGQHRLPGSESPAVRLGPAETR